MFDDTRNPSDNSRATHPIKEAHSESASQPSGLAVLDCPSMEARVAMTSSWDVADWYSAMLDLGNYYEEELQELSVQTVGQLVSYPIGCILAMILFWLLWGRLGLLPPVGTRELSQLAWFALTLFSCSIGPLVELVGYARPSFSDGFLAGYCPGVFYCAATAVEALPAARIAVAIATAITIIRIVLYAVRELSDDAGSLLSGAVFGIRARLLDLAIALHFVLIALLVVTSLTAKVFPTADRTAARGVATDTEIEVAQAAWDGADASGLGGSCGEPAFTAHACALTPKSQALQRQ